MAARWPLFAGVAGTVLILLVTLARLSAATVPDDRQPRLPNGGAVGADDAGSPAFERGVEPANAEIDPLDSETERLGSENEHLDPEDERPGSEGERLHSDQRRETGHALGDIESMSTSALLVNVALSQGLLGLFLLFGAWYAEIPPAAFGVVVGDPWSVGVPALGLGLGFGVALYAANELMGVAVEDLGIDFSEELREVLAPETPTGWLVLLVVVLPAIAAFEEFLFRAALVGALAAGFGVSPWVLAALSSVAFAVGHGMQGPGGVLVTGLLGFVLAAAFVLTGSLLVVVVAHYVVNALEFVVHEGLGVEPFRKGGG